MSGLVSGFLGSLVPGLNFIEKLPWKALALIGVTVAVLWFGHSWMKEQNEKEQQLIDAKISSQLEKAHSDQLEKANESLQRATEISMKAAEDSRDAILKLDSTISSIRDTANAQKRVFDEHELTKLTNAKAGLIEHLANKATEERMQDLSEALK